MATGPGFIGPPDPASLTGTLTPAGLMTPSDVALQQIMAELAGRTTAAVNASQQAAQQYQQAAAAPPPDIPALAAFIPTLAANLASVIGGQPAYAERNQQDLAAQRKQMMEARLQNLQSLRDNQSQLAEAARQAGNLEMEGKRLVAVARYDKEADALRSQMEASAAQKRVETQGEYGLKEARIRGEYGLREAQVRAGATSAAAADEAYQPLVRETAMGSKFMDLSNLSPKDASAAMRYGAANGMVGLKGAQYQAVTDVDRARKDVLSIWDYLQGLLPKDAAGRSVFAANMKISRALQTNEQRSAFRSFRDAAIPILRATTAGPGLRISNELVRLAIDNLPRDNDTFGTAERKAGVIMQVLANAESPLINRNWKLSPPTAGGGYTKAWALVSAARGDRDAFIRTIRGNPGLDNDPDVIKAARDLKGQ